MQVKSTLSEKEVKKFDALSEDWWDETSKSFRLLHRMNPIRINFILKNAPELKGLQILDVGAGGGILSLPLARLGARMTALEPSSLACESGQAKARQESLSINFINSSLENFPESQYDIILLMDVIEHVENPETFLQIAASKLKNGGILITSTINNTFFSKILVKYVAENILRLLPAGTHEAEKFISPQTIIHYLPNFQEISRQGFLYNPVTSSFKYINTVSLNYFLCLKKL